MSNVGKLCHLGCSLVVLTMLTGAPCSPQSINGIPNQAVAWDAPPAGAAEFSNLQLSGNGYGTWEQCNTSACSGSESGSTGTSSLTFDVTSPSLSGSAMEINSTTTSGEYFNTLTYIHLGCTSLPNGCVPTINRQFLLDLWFYIPSANAGMNALEFDPDLYDGSYEYFSSQQCDSSSGDWRLWNMGGGTWETTAYPCNLYSTENTWHHYTIRGYFNRAATSYVYSSFVLDGTVIYSNLNQSYSAEANSGTATFNMEAQIGGDTNTGTNLEYLDNVNLWIW